MCEYITMDIDVHLTWNVFKESMNKVHEINNKVNSMMAMDRDKGLFS